jgi:hypothetical protein
LKALAGTPASRNSTQILDCPTLTIMDADLTCSSQHVKEIEFFLLIESLMLNPSYQLPDLTSLHGLETTRFPLQ